VPKRASADEADRRGLWIGPGDGGSDRAYMHVIAGGLWLAARAGNDRERRQTDHIVVTAILRLIDQKRPAGSMHGPWAATGHTSFGQALRCFSVGACASRRESKRANAPRELVAFSPAEAGH